MSVASRIIALLVSMKLPRSIPNSIVPELIEEKTKWLFGM